MLIRRSDGLRIHLYRKGWYDMKKIIAAALAAAAMLSVTGCADGLSNVSTFIEAGGRDYGDTIINKIGEAQRNTFFFTTVNEVNFTNEVGDYYLDDGYEFVCVDVTVKNCYNQIIPMGYSDFYIRWGEGDENWDVPAYYDDLADDAYEYSFELAVGEDYTGVLYFVVPTERDDKLQLIYEELYEDDFVGSTYIIELE